MWGLLIINILYIITMQKFENFEHWNKLLNVDSYIQNQNNL